MLSDLQTGTVREVDICIEGRVGGQTIRVGFECRDHKRPADVSWLESMKAKHETLPTHGLVLVSKSGFTAEAERKARLYNIVTHTYAAIDERTALNLIGLPSSLWGKAISLTPISVRIHVSETGGLNEEVFEAFVDTEVLNSDHVVLGQLSTIVEFWMNQHAKELLRQLQDPSQDWFVMEFKWNPQAETPPYYVRKIDPPLIIPVIGIRITGRCNAEITEFPLQTANLGDDRFAWSTATFLGRHFMVVAASGTQDKPVVRADLVD
jgi:hypothetical protein